jgi:hypothetical protein
MKMIRVVLAMALACSTSACIGIRQYRTLYEPCVDAADPNCAKSAIHDHHEATRDQEYSLEFVEFDDQGELWDRGQADAVLNHLIDQLTERDLIVVVYAHGWKHSAAPDDTDVAMFRRNLELVSQVEAHDSRERGLPARRVAGVYLGWRGGSVSLPVVKELTFWDRKNTAHEVGRGGVLEILLRLEQLASLRESLLVRPDEPPPPKPRNRMRLVVIGHSFGGAVIYSALEHILEERFVQTTDARYVGPVRGFGDLVVLINPAFEALRFATLADMSTERDLYLKEQKPVLAILTSEGDDATRLAFPAGRCVSTLFERERKVERKTPHGGPPEIVDEGAADRRAIGHFSPYRTHWLRPSAESFASADIVSFLGEHATELRAAWGADEPGGTLAFPGTQLERRPSTVSRNPYLVVRVDEDIIPDHGTIDDERVVFFLEQLILLATDD